MTGVMNVSICSLKDQRPRSPDVKNIKKATDISREYHVALGRHISRILACLTQYAQLHILFLDAVHGHQSGESLID